mmetsp:Transcript_123916/g.346975  ORF Transcript_123916/g.346975 Transcript_123916/m.346975 type:complete len:251 (+) Transcript_123916:337-1089(+)
MSRPRAATSVAMSTPRRNLPFPGLATEAVISRNVDKASSRSHCSLPLWSALHQRLEPGGKTLFKLCSKSLQVLFICAKTMAVSPSLSSVSRTFFNLSIFSCSWMSSTCCLTLVFAVSFSPSLPCPILTWTASLAVSVEAMACTSFGHVAVKNRVWRMVPAWGPVAPPACSGLPVLGHCWTILLMSASKPMSNIRSASSNTRYVTLLRFSGADRPRFSSPAAKSSRRPGVAMSTSQPRRSSRIWSPFATPP